MCMKERMQNRKTRRLPVRRAFCVCRRYRRKKNRKLQFLLHQYGTLILTYSFAYHKCRTNEENCKCLKWITFRPKTTHPFFLRGGDDVGIGRRFLISLCKRKKVAEIRTDCFLFNLVVFSRVEIYRPFPNHWA